MANKKANRKKTASKGSSRAVIITVCAVLALAILVGGVFGVIYAVRQANAVVSFEGTLMSEGVASYFISRFKVDYISATKGASDTAEFWGKMREDGLTEGEFFEKMAVLYLREITVTCYLFDRYHTLNADDRRVIKNSAEDVLELQMGGDIDAFNREGAKYGFDYDDFTDAVEMLYKSAHSFAVIYGADGSGVSYDTAACESYLDEYSHVKLIFIRTDDLLVTGVDGREELVPLTSEQRAEREKNAAALRGAIAALKSGEDGQITPEMFDIYLEKHSDGDHTMDGIGYYFHRDSETTAEFAEAFPTVVSAALDMKVGEYREVKTELIDADEKIGFNGYCFIYKYPKKSGDYASAAQERWFSDFYKNAARAAYLGAIADISPMVKCGKRLDGMDFTLIPKNTEIVLRGFKQ